MDWWKTYCIKSVLSRLILHISCQNFSKNFFCGYKKDYSKIYVVVQRNQVAKTTLRKDNNLDNQDCVVLRKDTQIGRQNGKP